jgi:hypothetical protein
MDQIIERERKENRQTETDRLRQRGERKNERERHDRYKKELSAYQRSNVSL